MNIKLSLTARLSLIFSGVMLAVWWLSCVLLVTTLNNYFDNQDRDFINGKIQLTEKILKSEAAEPEINTPRLVKKITDAMVGHTGLFIIITDANNKKLVELYSQNMPLPASLLSHAGNIPGYMAQSSANNTVYRSISQKVTVSLPANRERHFMIIVATDIGYHKQFMEQLGQWLFWFNLGLLFIAVLLGWIATRIGLKPLREMTRLASGITINNLDQRLDPASAPTEISGTVQAFNNMLDRLEGSFRRLSDFSSDIAHELRTPVSNLMMQTQFALAKERDVDHYREILFANLDELKRLSRMSSDMLFLARSEHGLLQLAKTDIDLASELKELIELFEPFADETGKKITLEGIGVVSGDADILRQAFSNLLSNAIKYAPPYSEIAIQLTEHNKKICVCFTNTSADISAINPERLFDRFYRADASRGNYPEGSGLGLSITRSIIHAHGGELTVELNGPYIVFSVYLSRY